ncbi:MAG: Stf0 family sulfotransferase [Pseudomonadota bacterium]
MSQSRNPGSSGYDGFIMQSLPRSGTSFILDYTNGTGAFGHAEEYLNQNVIAFSDATTADEHFEMAMNQAFGTANLFSMKIFPRQLVECVDHHGYDFIQRCTSEYSVQFVRLRRKDTIARAVSFYKALQDKRWATDRGGETIEIPYDFKKIYRAWISLIKAEAFWDTYNSMHQIEPIEFTYEELESEPSKFMHEMCSIFNVEPNGVKLLRKLKKQRDERSAEFCERFRRELSLDEFRDQFVDNRNQTVELRKAPRTWSNLFRLLAQKPLKVRL